MFGRERYVFAVIHKGEYDLDETFDDAMEAIRLAISGEEVAVLDSLDLSYKGLI